MKPRIHLLVLILLIGSSQIALAIRGPYLVEGGLGEVLTFKSWNPSSENRRLHAISLNLISYTKLPVVSLIRGESPNPILTETLSHTENGTFVSSHKPSIGVDEEIKIRIDFPEQSTDFTFEVFYYDGFIPVGPFYEMEVSDDSGTTFGDAGFIVTGNILFVIEPSLSITNISSESMEIEFTGTLQKSLNLKDWDDIATNEQSPTTIIKDGTHGFFRAKEAYTEN